jgi:hypothetical protein
MAPRAPPSAGCPDPTLPIAGNWNRPRDRGFLSLEEGTMLNVLIIGVTWGAALFFIFNM